MKLPLRCGLEWHASWPSHAPLVMHCIGVQCAADLSSYLVVRLVMLFLASSARSRLLAVCRCCKLVLHHSSRHIASVSCCSSIGLAQLSAPSSRQPWAKRSTHLSLGRGCMSNAHPNDLSRDGLSCFCFGSSRSTSSVLLPGFVCLPGFLRFLLSWAMRSGCPQT